MDPTVPPWPGTWRREHRTRMRTRLSNEYWHGPRLSLYTGNYRSGGEVSSRHIIRFQDGLGTRELFPTPANTWLHHQPQFLLDTLQLSNSMPEIKNSEFESYVTEPPAPPLPAQRVHWSESALGWAAGTLLLAFFLLIVRATEKCLDRRLFKARRRQSEEWPTPNVLATSQQLTASDTSPMAQELQIDPPPPYSECTRPKPQSEDPPPPYSDCYVSFVNPKDGVASAHIMMRERSDNEANVGTGSQDSNANSGLSEGNDRNENPDESVVGNRETVSHIDVEATNNAVEIVGVHIGSIVGNTSCVIKNETLRV